MKRLILKILNIFLTILLTKSDSLTSKDYVNLISEISKWSKSTSVALLHFTPDDGK